jgi:outer membrane immunogenic protein
MVSPAQNWTGFYVGVMGGYGWSDEITGRIAGVGAATISSDDLKGGFAGGTLGYNWQTGQFVFGIEADAAWSDIKYTETVLGVTAQDRIRAFGSVTGRLGFLASPDLLLYAKGGYAWAENQFRVTAPGVLFSESQIHSGWTVGGGAEWMFAPNWSAKVEYMYADYGFENYLRTFVATGIDVSATVHTVKGGINYHF